MKLKLTNIAREKELISHSRSLTHTHTKLSYSLLDPIGLLILKAIYVCAYSIKHITYTRTHCI